MITTLKNIAVVMVGFYPMPKDCRGWYFLIKFYPCFNYPNLMKAC